MTRYEYDDRYQDILNHIETERETRLIIDVEPEKVSGKINPAPPRIQLLILLNQKLSVISLVYSSVS